LKKIHWHLNKQFYAINAHFAYKYSLFLRGFFDQNNADAAFRTIGRRICTSNTQFHRAIEFYVVTKYMCTATVFRVKFSTCIPGYPRGVEYTFRCLYIDSFNRINVRALLLLKTRTTIVDFISANIVMLKIIAWLFTLLRRSSCMLATFYVIRHLFCVIISD